MPIYCSLHHENPDGIPFCDECGEPLTGAGAASTATTTAAPTDQSQGTTAQGGTQTCPSCGALNEVFCSNCGVVLSGMLAPAPAAVQGTSPATEMPLADQEHLDILKQGVEVWNQWRRKHLDILPNLSDANLISANLSRADLNDADLISADLSDANLNRADLSRADLSNVNLSNANLSGAVLVTAQVPLFHNGTYNPCPSI